MCSWSLPLVSLWCYIRCLIAVCHAWYRVYLLLNTRDNQTPTFYFNRMPSNQTLYNGITSSCPIFPGIRCLIVVACRIGTWLVYADKQLLFNTPLIIHNTGMDSLLWHCTQIQPHRIEGHFSSCCLMVAVSYSYFRVCSACPLAGDTAGPTGRMADHLLVRAFLEHHSTVVGNWAQENIIWQRYANTYCGEKNSMLAIATMHSSYTFIASHILVLIITIFALILAIYNNWHCISLKHACHMAEKKLVFCLKQVITQVYQICAGRWTPPRLFPWGELHFFPARCNGNDPNSWPVWFSPKSQPTPVRQGEGHRYQRQLHWCCCSFQSTCTAAGVAGSGYACRQHEPRRQLDTLDHLGKCWS